MKILTLERRVEALEKKVAALEQTVQLNKGSTVKTKEVIKRFCEVMKQTNEDFTHSSKKPNLKKKEDTI